jgi:hypothetical protein
LTFSDGHSIAQIMAQEITHYQGDTFIADGTYTDANGDPVDLNVGGIVVESYIRDRNGVKKTIPVTIGGTIGQYHLESATDDWPLGRVTWHIRYVQGTIKRSTEPVIINVETA